MRIDRDAAGRIRALRKGRGRELRQPEGVSGKFDTEGLALRAGRGFTVSTEDPARLLGYTGPEAAPEILPPPPGAEDFGGNRGFEALARDPGGALWTLPESVEDESLRPLILGEGGWSEGPRLPGGGGFVPVGLDFDEKGRLYLLERQFDLPFRFRARVRRFAFAGAEVAREELLLSGRPGQYDNLEGISVWRAADGRRRVTLVSDDNFLALQETQLVEFDAPG